MASVHLIIAVGSCIRGCRCNTLCRYILPYVSAPNAFIHVVACLSGGDVNGTCCRHGTKWPDTLSRNSCAG